MFIFSKLRSIDTTDLSLKDNHRQGNSRCVHKEVSFGPFEAISPIGSYPTVRRNYTLSISQQSLAGSAAELKDHVDRGAGGNVVGVEGLVVGTGWK